MKSTKNILRNLVLATIIGGGLVVGGTATHIVNFHAVVANMQPVNIVHPH